MVQFPGPPSVPPASPLATNQKQPLKEPVKNMRRSRLDADAYVPKIMKQGPVVPWLYLAPALVVMAIFIVYPGVQTLILSLMNKDSTQSATAACISGQACWGIFENYRYALTSEIMRTAFLNNLKWILVMVTSTVVLGLLVAVLADRVRYEPLAKAIIFMPMAISFVGAGVIWTFVYNYGTGVNQIGLLNAIAVALGGQPVSWLSEPAINTIALIFVGVWMWTGFCMTVLSASIKSVPVEMLEAARVDGATEIQAFQHITIPTIMPTLAVITTTMVINVLKVFDIVYVMTGGNYNTEVIANRMYIDMYSTHNAGRATAIAVILILVTIPVMIYNVRRFQEQEASR